MNRPTILCVDDDQDLLELLTLLLERIEYNIISASNGQEGLAIASRDQPTLIMMDLTMPVMDGVMALKLLQANIQTCEIPVIIMTGALPGDALLQQAIDGGANGYLKKPIISVNLYFDIEIRHALRLLLIYQDAHSLTDHLQRCLDDPAYGYGERGDQGRTIAQAMAALTDEETSLGDIVEAWLEVHREFQQSVLSGMPMDFSGMFEYTDVDAFAPLLQRIGDTTWRLGLEGEGQHQDFQGDLAQVWPAIADTYVSWLEQDNDTWLADIKKKATRLPDHIARAALADRALRKYDDLISLKGNTVTLTSTPDGGDWPRTLVMYNQAGQPQLGLSRLSGHAFYEVSWDGGLHIRRFEVSSTSRNRIPFEHIELATRFAEALGAEFDLRFAPISAEEIEAAYLRRMKADTAVLQKAIDELPPAIKGIPAAMYVVNGIIATILTGGDDLVYAVPDYEGKGSTAVLLTRNDKRGVIMAVPVQRGRPRRGSVLMTTPLDGTSLSDPAVNRSLCAWAAWLAWSLLPKEAKQRQ